MLKAPYWIWMVAVAPIFMQAALAQDKGPATPIYHLAKAVPLGAPDKWDYLVFDDATHRLFVAHGDRVTILDGHDGAVLGNVEGMPGGAHGIGISNETGKGYTDDGGVGTVVAFDLKTFKTSKSIKAPEHADGIAFDPRSGHIFVMTGLSAKIIVIDPKSDTAIATIDGGGELEYAVSGNNGKLYINGAENKEILRVDTVSNKVDAHWPIPGCTSPHGLAIDTSSHRLFVSCYNSVLTVVDAERGRVIATLPIGQGTDGATFDPKRKLIFASANDGTVSVIRENDPQTFVSMGSIKTAVTGKNMTIDPQTGRLFVVVADTDPKAPIPHNAQGQPRPKPLPGTSKVLFLDPVK